jgi:hypothetical protein
MKKIKILCFLSLAAVLVTSCKQKFLEDMKSYDKFDESIFTNEVQTGWYIDRMYYDFFSAYKSPVVSVVGLYNDTRTRMTEEMGGNVPNMINPQKTLVDAKDADNYYGNALSSGVQNNPYSRIRNANFLLQKIDEKGQNLTAEFKKRARGQALFLRALQYYDLVRVYGGVPIVTTVEVASPNDESIKHQRAKPSEVFAQIVKDFDSAAVLLPPVWDATNYGRYTSGAALAMKSRVLLTFASPLFNPDWDNPGNERWQKALDAGLAAEIALTSAGVGLFGSSAKDWGEMWYKNADNAPSNKEAIMIRMLSSSNAASGIESNGWERSIRVTKQSGSGGVAAPKEMLDLFPLADGSRPVVGTNYNDTFFFMNRDPRFYRTFAFSGAKWPTKENPNDVVWLYRWKDASNKVYYSDGNNVLSPAVVRKMSNPSASTAALPFSGTDIFEYRYAELLLNIAECYAAKGDIGNCIKYLGMIRNRVGIAAANNYGIGTLSSKYQAIEAVLYERRVELAYEGKRFWDIQRWMLYNDDAAAGNSTNARLGIAQINGTTRTGKHWQYKTNVTSADPLTAARGTISVDPDAANFTTQLNALKAFFQSNLTLVPTDQPMDKDGSGQLLPITFRQNYYISGLTTTVLAANPWLQQTIGWNDASGGSGTFNYRQ